MPVKRRKTQAVVSLLSILIILTIDQCSKRLVHLRLSVGDSIPLIKDVLHITFVSNTGGAFGLFKSGTSLFIAVSVIAVIVIFSIIATSMRKGKFLSDPLLNVGLVLIASGALGNLLDRVRFGYVIDFIDVRIWPVFNMADISITIGTFLLIISFVSPRPSLK